MLHRLFGRRPALDRDEATAYVTALYRVVLGREPDPPGLADHVNALLARRVSVPGLLGQFAESEEYKLRAAGANPLEALHRSRVAMVQQLPAARRIVDLGGGADNRPEGALVVMGYPHPFESLTIVEPPAAGRHEIYQQVPDGLTEVRTPLGPVRYLYASMADLAPVASASVDLVFSGESIEHVSREDCVRTLAEVRRILAPDGWFCFDTPNRGITKIQSPGEYINPDHKYEYTHAEMTALLAAAGFEVAEAKGLTWMPKTRATGVFRLSEMLENVGVYDDIEDCYLLYYRCRIAATSSGPPA